MDKEMYNMNKENVQYKLNTVKKTIELLFKNCVRL